VEKQRWIIINIDDDGECTMEDAGTLLPRLGGPHLHIEGGQIVAIHALAEHSETAEHALLEFWKLQRSGEMPLEESLDGERHYDMSTIEVIRLLAEQANSRAT